MTDQSPVTRLGLLRHSLTDWNLEGRIQGQRDNALSSAGQRQAAQWGELLRAYPWDRIIASDARRAQETATVINASLHLPIHRDPRLREQDWGDWTGKTLDQLRQEAPLVLAEQENAGWDFCPPGGENRHQVCLRSLAAMVEAVENWPGERILVVTHEGVIRCLVYGLYGRRFLPGEPAILRRRSLHWLIHDREGLRVERLNAVSLSSAHSGETVHGSTGSP